MMLHKRRDSGFSLVEMLVAVAILGVLSAQMFSVFSSQRRVYLANQRVLDVQEDTRVVLDLITFDARMAGFMIPKIAGVSSGDGGVNASDRFCVSDSAYYDFPTAGGTSESLDDAYRHLDAALVTLATFNQVDVASMDVDLDNAPVDFAAGRGIIVSDGLNSHCARILTVTPPNQITLAPGHEIPAAFFVIAAQARAVPALIYEVNEPTLTLTRNSLTLATGVEDLQVEFWVDNSTNPANGVIDNADEFPVDDLNNQGGPMPMDTSEIRRIRITVITRANQTDGGATQENMSRRRPASANRVAGAPDAFRRRRFTTSILPRNLL